METGRRDNNKHETGEFNMSLVGKIIIENDNIALQCTNKSNESYIWNPERFFYSILNQLKKLNKDGVYVNIHMHALNDKESCEIGRFLTGTKAKFLKRKDT